MKKRIILAFIVTIILVAVLLSQINLGSIISAIFSIPPIYFLTGFILYLISYLLKTMRSIILLSKNLGIRDLFPIICIHNVANYLFPARSGELSYIYLLKRVQNIPVSEGISTLMIARVFDFIAVSLLFFISVFLVKDMPALFSNFILFIAFLFIVILLFLVSLLYHGEKFLIVIRRFCSILKLAKFKFVNFFLKKLEEIVKNFNIIKSKRTLIHSLILSLLTWISIYFFTYLLLLGMNIRLGIETVILGSTFSILTGILPIQGIGNFGTYETAWMILFIPLGITKEMAIISGFTVHIISIIYSLILGSFGLYKLRTKYLSI